MPHTARRMVLPDSATSNRDRGRSATAATAWTTLAILSGLNLLNYLDRYIMSAVLTPMQKELKIDDGDAGWAASAFMLGYFLTAPVFGWLGDRYPRKFLMLAGVVVWSLATAACGLAHSFAVLFAIRMVVGVGEACFVTMSPSWISDLFAATRRNTALTLFYIAVPVGSAIGYTVGGQFAQHGDWRHAFIFAGLPGVLFALTLLLLREPPRGEADHLAADAARHEHARPLEIARLLLNRRYSLLVWGYAAQTFAIGAFAFWGPSFLNRVHQLPQDRSSAIFGEMLAGTGLVATLLGGFVASSLRKRIHAGYVWVMAVSMIAAAPVSYFALSVADANWSLIGLGATMFFIFLPTGPVTTEIFEIVPVHLRASAVALCTFVIHLFGDFSSPTAVGHISDHFGGDLQKGVLALPAVLLIGAVLWSVLIYFTRAPEEVVA
jgi:MFS family permease